MKIEKRIESTNCNNSACPAGQRSHIRISHQDCRTQNTTHNYSSAETQPHRSPVNSQQANHNNSPGVFEPLFPGVRAKAKRIGDDVSMMPSRMRLEVRSQYNLKIDPGASTLDARPPPWEAQRPPGVEMPYMSAALVDLCCRALECRQVYIVLNGP